MVQITGGDKDLIEMSSWDDEPTGSGFETPSMVETSGGDKDFMEMSSWDDEAKVSDNNNIHS
jgi:hypothetical protein